MDSLEASTYVLFLLHIQRAPYSQFSQADICKELVYLRVNNFNHILRLVFVAWIKKMMMIKTKIQIQNNNNIISSYPSNESNLIDLTVIILFLLNSKISGLILFEQLVENYK